jgi:hypothetical protein
MGFAMTMLAPVSGPLSHITDDALLPCREVAKLKVFGSGPKLDADRAAGRGLPFIRLGGRCYYVGAVLKQALADAIAAGARSRAEAVAASRAPLAAAHAA